MLLGGWQLLAVRPARHITSRTGDETSGGSVNLDRVGAEADERILKLLVSNDRVAWSPVVPAEEVPRDGLRAGVLVAERGAVGAGHKVDERVRRRERRSRTAAARGQTPRTLGRELDLFNAPVRPHDFDDTTKYCSILSSL